MLKGVLHFHSTYSDGEFTITELRRIYSDAGCHFALITDHAESFDQPKLEKYVAECEANSDGDFLFIPSLEFSCDKKMHVLGYGVTELTRMTDAQQVIGHIGNSGGVAVIAHPRNDMLEWIETFASLPDGIEAWNTKYDGQYAPRREVFELIQRLQERKPELRAFYGQDLHWKKQYRGLFNVLDVDTHSRESILQALAEGKYHGLKDGLELPSDAHLTAIQLADFQRVNDRSATVRGFAKATNAFLKRLHLKVPDSIKAHIRRIF